MEKISIILGIAIIAIAIAATVITYRKTVSVALRVGATVGNMLIIAAACLFILVNNLSFQTKMVMTGMEGVEPFKAIISTDPQMTAKIEAAVRRGLQIKEGDKVSNVKAEVAKEIEPYLKYRAMHASDTLVVEAAAITLNMLKTAKADSDETCIKAIKGDKVVTAPYKNKQAAWMTKVIKAEALDEVRRASDEEALNLVSQVASQKGWTPVDVLTANTTKSPITCDYTISILEAAMLMPEDKAAEMIRRFGLAGRV